MIIGSFSLNFDVTKLISSSSVYLNSNDTNKSKIKFLCVSPITNLTSWNLIVSSISLTTSFNNETYWVEHNEILTTIDIQNIHELKGWQ